MSKLAQEYHKVLIAIIQEAGGAIRIPFHTLEALQTGETPAFIAENDESTRERIFRLDKP